MPLLLLRHKILSLAAFLASAALQVGDEKRALELMEQAAESEPGNVMVSGHNSRTSDKDAHGVATNDVSLSGGSVLNIQGSTINAYIFLRATKNLFCPFVLSRGKCPSFYP